MPSTLERTIGIETWKDWQAAGRRAQLVDVRSASEFATAHLPGAINIPLEQIELRTSDLEANAPVVLVCQAGTRAHIASALLAASGRDLVVLEGGTGAWLNAGYPAVRSTRARWALERQVRLIAGLLVIVGVLLRSFIALVADQACLRGLRVGLCRFFRAVSHGRNAGPATVVEPH